jgi:hypothetical protein
LLSKYQTIVEEKRRARGIKNSITYPSVSYNPKTEEDRYIDRVNCKGIAAGFLSITRKL